MKENNGSLPPQTKSASEIIVLKAPYNSKVATTDNIDTQPLKLRTFSFRVSSEIDKHLNKQPNASLYLRGLVIRDINQNQPQPNTAPTPKQIIKQLFLKKQEIIEAKKSPEYAEAKKIVEGYSTKMNRLREIALTIPTISGLAFFDDSLMRRFGFDLRYWNGKSKGIVVGMATAKLEIYNSAIPKYDSEKALPTDKPLISLSVESEQDIEKALPKLLHLLDEEVNKEAARLEQIPDYAMYKTILDVLEADIVELEGERKRLEEQIKPPRV